MRALAGINALLLGFSLVSFGCQGGSQAADPENRASEAQSPSRGVVIRAYEDSTAHEVEDASSHHPPNVVPFTYRRLSKSEFEAMTKDPLRSLPLETIPDSQKKLCKVLQLRNIGGTFEVPLYEYEKEGILFRDSVAYSMYIYLTKSQGCWQNPQTGMAYSLVLRCEEQRYIREMPPEPRKPETFFLRQGQIVLREEGYPYLTPSGEYLIFTGLNSEIEMCEMSKCRLIAPAAYRLSVDPPQFLWKLSVKKRPYVGDSLGYPIEGLWLNGGCMSGLDEDRDPLPLRSIEDFRIWGVRGDESALIVQAKVAWAYQVEKQGKESWRVVKEEQEREDRFYILFDWE